MKNKKIISSLLIISMMLCLMPIKMFMATEPEPPTVSLKILPDKTTAHPGDTITYTIKMGPVENFAAMQLQLNIPNGLNYDPESGQLVNGIDSTLNLNIDPSRGEPIIDTTDPQVNPNNTQINFSTFDDDNKRIVIYGGNYTSNSNTDIATFTCKVDNKAAEGDYNISLTEHILVDNDATQIPEDISNLESTVTITDAPQGLLGDVNGDGSVDAQDMQAVFDIMTGKIDDAEYISRADVNSDNSIDAQDMQMIFDIMTGKIPT